MNKKFKASYSKYNHKKTNKKMEMITILLINKQKKSQKIN